MNRSWLIGLIAALGVSTHASAAVVGTAEQLQGTASAIRGNQELRLKAGDPISENDELTTGPGSKLIVAFADGTRVTLGANGDLVIDAFVYNPGGGENRAALKVAAGAMRFVAGAVEKVGGSQAVKVDTPVATIGIRGTDFFVELDNPHLSVALFSGSAVGVSNGAGTTVLRPGEGTDVFGGLAPSPAKPWAADRINRALTLTSVTPVDQRPMPYARAVASATAPSDALVGGKFVFDFRLRSESVDQSSKPRTGEATTGRLRVGYESEAFNGFYAGVSGEVTRNFDRTVRNDGVNGRTDLPLIADPSAEVLHEAYAAWSDRDGAGLARNQVVLGRQRLLYENERWVGPSEFRQNAQSFDAASVQVEPVDRLTLRYAYVSRVNRILGDNPNGHWSSNSHLIGAITNVLPYGITTAYANLLDLRPVPQFSSATVGVRYDGQIPIMESRDGTTAALLEAEVARQSNYGRNPQSFALSYWLVQPGIAFPHATLSAGWEQLDGNGRVAVQTPLATLHRQNGWADVFTVTPAGGLRDAHVRWLQELPDLGLLKMPKLDVRLLDFASAGGAHLHYGREYDADFNTSVSGLFTLGFRFARYDADHFDANTTKFWAYAEFHY